jgi:enoyl-CoA hydratase/carnithine racemase
VTSPSNLRDVTVSTIIYDLKDRVCTITRNRPEVLNVFNIDLIGAPGG